MGLYGAQTLWYDCNRHKRPRVFVDLPPACPRWRFLVSGIRFPLLSHWLLGLQSADCRCPKNFAKAFPAVHRSGYRLLVDRYGEPIPDRDGSLLAARGESHTSPPFCIAIAHLVKKHVLLGLTAHYITTGGRSTSVWKKPCQLKRKKAGQCEKTPLSFRSVPASVCVRWFPLPPARPLARWVVGG